MFDFFGMMGSEEIRKVDRYEVEGMTVDTCRVTDGSHLYETDVSHLDYNMGKWIVVEAYDTEDAAQEGHDRWVKIMTTEPLPQSLKECGNSYTEQLLHALAGQGEFFRNKV